MALQDTPTTRSDLVWRIVGLVNLYRLLAIIMLAAVHFLDRPLPAFGADNPRLFQLVLAFYALLAILLAAAGRRHWPSRRTLVLTHSLIDAAAVAVLLYTSGGVVSGLAVLLVLPVGALALLADGREPFFVAAIAVIGLLGQQIVTQLYGGASTSDYTLAGVMGGVIFVVALSVWSVSKRLRESDALVRRQELDLANLAQLSQYIVQHLRESILVVDPTDRIRLINESAAQMLGDRTAVPGALIGEVLPELLYRLATWRQARKASNDDGTSGTFTAADGSTLIEPHFAALGASDPAPVLIFLEDTSALAARIQQSKLASLGRLSASIAHEIRNPVGAMSHAAQLLAESTHLDEAERRLTDIISNHAQRVSGIIENVLSLSRRTPPRPESLNVLQWCERFHAEFCATVQCEPRRIRLLHAQPGLEIRFDPSQLHQIVWNLSQNALHHGANKLRPEQDVVEIRSGRMPSNSRPFLEVADRGPGVDEQDVGRVFEPFFTRGERGTGLGLFLARELAEVNDATLLYVPRDGGGSIFRLVFSDPLRWASTHA